MQIRLHDESQIDPATGTALRSLLAECFPYNSRLFSANRHWRGNVPLFTSIATDKTHVVACAVVIDRTIRIGARPVRVAGVGNVCVLPDYRGGGIVDRILLAAMEEAAGRQFEWGMLFCRPEIMKVYERTGWQSCMDRRFVRIDHTTGQPDEIPADHGKMFLRIGYRPLPPGDIDLQGDKW
jgi:predicted N-acetyltransferase YhbS